MRVAAQWNLPHPELIARRDAFELATYRIQRRRFMIEHPDESAPPDFTDLGMAWIGDLITYSHKDAEARLKAEEG